MRWRPGRQRIRPPRRLPPARRPEGSEGLLLASDATPRNCQTSSTTPALVLRLSPTPYRSSPRRPPLAPRPRAPPAATWDAEAYRHAEDELHGAAAACGRGCVGLAGDEAPLQRSAGAAVAAHCDRRRSRSRSSGLTGREVAVNPCLTCLERLRILEDRSLAPRHIGRACSPMCPL
jgi:hypothetical protein